MGRATWPTSLASEPSGFRSGSAGSYASPERVRQARDAGAAGVQVGTLFAFCRESGIDPALKERVLDEARSGGARVFTDPLASPTGFPFKVLRLEGTLSEPAVYEARQRLCDLGYLRELYRRSDGTVGYRCPGEPLEDYVRKGGPIEETHGRKCICNGLLATVGLGQRRKTGPEPPIVTSGDDLERRGSSARRAGRRRIRPRTCWRTSWVRGAPETP